MKHSSDVWRLVDEKRQDFIALSDRIWSMPEVCYTEVRSSAEHATQLERHGFRVSRNVAGIPTALTGEAGEGGPIIAILGEYDALPGLSQEAGVAEQQPIVPGGNGHGCGHNLLGSAAMLAAVALRDWLTENGIPGRVRYYGCPAEEGGAAKTFMVRAGVFADVDAAISWHPYAFTEVMPPVALANTRVDFTFIGRASHAAAAPHLGRSALDAVELMNVGVNYMREHMPSDARVHYAVLDTGGIAPNVVQAHARVRYSVRARDLRGMRELLERVRKIAEGAALMTETRMEMTIISAVSNLLPNRPLERAMFKVMQTLGVPDFDTADLNFADEIQATLSEEDILSAYRVVGLPRTNTSLSDRIVPLDSPHELSPGSTDVGDVSWVTPTVQAHCAVSAVGTPFHSWQLVAQGKAPAAHKGMVHAAKTMAATAAALITDETLLEEAKQEHAMRLQEQPYTCPIPAGIEPPLWMSTGKV
ncbi:M20 family metallopeptidase [Microvirga splendida]|uniref:Amidohydrolase n=1 Tax=Microvirga splendida TaxID=2795727 RepID=A0ABS0Y4H2_9HYPH|nr:M20 family metallopeptidase [Microvirga splendida]MBJ6127174.1 amidohydrolase [Microvirga splendida]